MNDTTIKNAHIYRLIQQRLTKENRYLVFASLVIALGLVLVTAGFDASRSSQPIADVLFWAGIVLICLVTVVRIILPDVPRSERLFLLMALGIALYAVKLLHSPLYFTFSDEFSHWRTSIDIERFGELFLPNPMLPIATFYPTIAIIITMTSKVTGLSNFASGVILLLAVRVLWVGSLYLLYERVSSSPRIASGAVILYMSNPNFLFFNAQVAYESLSLPLALFAILLVLRWTKSIRINRMAIGICIILTIGVIVVTHHLTSYALAVLLASWAIASWVRPRNRNNSHNVVIFALFSIIAALAWFIFIGGKTATYLGSQFTTAIEEVINLIINGSSGRELFRSGTFVSPVWERVAGVVTTLFLIGLLPLGLWLIWTRYRKYPLVLLFGVFSLGYPVSLLLRFTYSGAETAIRSSEFIFVPFSFALSLALLFLMDHRFKRFKLPSVDKIQYAIIACALVIIFVGGIILGWAPWARMPGSYLPAADTRSIENQGISAALWMNTHIGPDKQLVTDRINRQLMGTFGEENPITSYFSGIPTYTVFFSVPFSQRVQNILRDAQIGYLVVDSRITTDLPASGVYFERGEPETWQREEPFNQNALFKFEILPRTHRMYDSGSIQIYDIRKFRQDAN